MPAIDAEFVIRCLACDAPMEALCTGREDGYFSCRHCCLVRAWPPPTAEALKSYYADSYEVDRENYIRGVNQNGENLLGLLTQRSGVGRLLEVGCSWGGFLALAESRGWKVAGVELSPEPARWAREREALEVHLGTLESSPFVGCGQFDVVVAWHVIEHLIDPLEFLRQAYSCLKPGGILALRTPNVASLIARMNGRAWEWFGAPAHLTLFSPAALDRTVQRAGFQIQEIRTRRGDANNPWFEFIRGIAVRASAGARIKKFLGWHANNPALRTRGDVHVRGSRRMQTLAQLNRVANVAFFFLYPAELLLNRFGGGSEIFLLGRRVAHQRESEAANGKTAMKITAEKR